MDISKMSKEYQARYERVKKAIALEPVDRIPIMGSGPAAYPHLLGVTLKDYISDMELNCNINIEASKIFDVDGAQAPIFSPEVLTGIWFTEVKVSGRELPDDELWQMDEKELMTEEDYDKIREIGWNAWKAQFMAENFPHFPERTAPYFQYAPIAVKRHAEAGFPTWVGAIFASPMEYICGGRTLVSFLIDDMMEDPDGLEEILDIAHEAHMADYRAMLENPETRPIGVWVGGWRGTPTMLSPQMFRRFSWKYMKDIANLCIEYDVIPIFHLDSDWTPGLEVFREIEPKKAIMALDSKTNIRKAKEVVGDMMCIMGDVPAEMFAFSKPEEVYQYCMDLIKDLGPTGFILCSGCDIPFNAKRENVDAMIQAIKDTEGKL